MYDIDLVNIPEDPTKHITKNRNFLSDLKKHGLEGKQVRKILRNYHGLDLHSCGLPPKKPKKKGWIKAEGLPEYNESFLWIQLEPGTFTSFNATDKEFHKNVDYALRTITSLLKNPVISGEAKSALIKERDRLLKIKATHSHKLPTERLLHQNEKDVTLKARSVTQMIGFQVVALYNYIKPIMKKTIREKALTTSSPHTHKDYREKDIFSLICEIFNATDSFKPYTEEYIKTLYNNNLK